MSVCKLYLIQKRHGSWVSRTQVSVTCFLGMLKEQFWANRKRKERLQKWRLPHASSDTHSGSREVDDTLPYQHVGQNRMPFILHHTLKNTQWRSHTLTDLKLMSKKWEVNVQRNTIHKRKYACFISCIHFQQKIWGHRFSYFDFWKYLLQEDSLSHIKRKHMSGNIQRVETS